MKKECVIVGAGTYGQVYAKYLADFYEIVGFIDDETSLHGQLVDGIDVLGGLEFLLSSRVVNTVFVPIGNNNVRVAILTRLAEQNFNIPSFIHETCTIDPSVRMGKAVYILPGTNVMPLSSLGNFVMVSMGVNIAHHTVIKEGCFFSQGVNVGASISFGKKVFCGIGSTIMTGVKNIEDSAYIGAGAVVINDVPAGVTMVGNPARVLEK